MTNTFNFDDYKLSLINYHVWLCDKHKQAERINYINTHYSDDYLRNIIINTQDFIFKLLSEIENINNSNTIFHKIELSPYDCKKYIFNGCNGGFFADRLFQVDNNESLVSINLIKNFFKSTMRIDINEQEMEYMNPNEEVGFTYYTSTFYISGSAAEFSKLYATCNSQLRRGKKLEKLMK